ncbi:hypothetical protein TIFTF001_020460 [Ficus carica]|uniref:Uncharacterized protein n=1 Tax=Ficus carica TaxID=3494 RepID=A0AA88AFT0_FICCA|nr:hypothetical protein TIFTF001_020460 [Ficus carica]
MEGKICKVGAVASSPIPREYRANPPSRACPSLTAMEPTDASSPFRPLREPSLSSANWTVTGASTSSSRDGAMVLRSGLQSSRRREEWSKWCMVSRATMVLPFASSVDAHLPLSVLIMSLGEGGAGGAEAGVPAGEGWGGIAGGRGWGKRGPGREKGEKRERGREREGVGVSPSGRTPRDVGGVGAEAVVPAGEGWGEVLPGAATGWGAAVPGGVGRGSGRERGEKREKGEERERGGGEERERRRERREKREKGEERERGGAGGGGWGVPEVAGRGVPVLEPGVEGRPGWVAGVGRSSASVSVAGGDGKSLALEKT